MKRPALCHPEKPNAGAGLCQKCYCAKRFQEKKLEPGFLEAKRARERARRGVRSRVNNKYQWASGVSLQQRRRTYRALWQSANPILRQVNEQRRRARLASASGRGLSLVQFQEALEVFNGCCAYCLEPVPGLTVDHFRPLSRGGEHDIDNVVPACLSCNASKGNGLVFDFVPRGVGVATPEM